MKRQKLLITAGILALGLLAAICLPWKEEAKDGKAEIAIEAKFESKTFSTDLLPNCLQVNTGIYSGGQPDGEKGLEQLSRMGVQAVLSVDGARPDVQFAEQFDLRYVHLPHGYDGIEKHHAMALAKAVAKFDGPIYIHCHHGKHRSPAAAVVACVGLGKITVEQGQQFLRDAGTSEHYKGLYRSVAEAEVFDEQVLRQIQVDLPSVSPPSQIVEAMVAIEKHFDALVRFDANYWKPLPNHPDLDAAHESLLLMEQFTELLRNHDYQGDEYDRLLKQSNQSSQELHELLSKSSQLANTSFSLTAGEYVNAIKQNCRTCHSQFRDSISLKTPRLQSKNILLECEFSTRR